MPKDSVSRRFVAEQRVEMCAEICAYLQYLHAGGRSNVVHVHVAGKSFRTNQLELSQTEDNMYTSFKTKWLEVEQSIDIGEIVKCQRPTCIYTGFNDSRAAK